MAPAADGRNHFSKEEKKKRCYGEYGSPITLTKNSVSQVTDIYKRLTRTQTWDKIGL